MADRSIVPVSTVLLGLLLLSGCTAGAQLDTHLPVTTCMQRAHLALRDSDFTERFGTVDEPYGKAAFGRHGSYWAKIRCFADQSGVDIEVTGPDPKYTKLYRHAISRRF